MRLSSSLSSLAFLVGAGLLAACNSDSSGSPSSADAGTSSTGGSASGAAGAGGSTAGSSGASGAGAAGKSAGGASAGGAAGASAGGAAGSTTGGAAGASTGGSAGASTGGSAGSNAAGSGGSALTIMPGDGTLLTCSSTQFTASASDATWIASAGMISATGLYAAPNVVGPDVTITATSASSTPGTATSHEKLATAVVGAKTTALGNLTDSPDVYPHGVVASGDRVYAAGIVTDASGLSSVVVTRSDDGGATFGAPVTATPPLASSDSVWSCVSLAIDAGNPDVVYLVGNASAHSGLAPKYVDPSIDDDRATMLFVSTDGGKTFPGVHAMQTGNSADNIPVAQAICPDVISFAKDTVGVSAPGASNEDVGIFFWVDTMQGAGFTPTFDAYNSISSEETGALTAIAADVGQNGGSNAPTEAPVLFTDGKGEVCITYVAFTPKGSGSPSSTAWVQCSTDGGKTFSAPANASPTYPYDGPQISHPHGALGPNGEMAVGWEGFQAEPVNGVNVAGVGVSTDGKTFKTVSPPVFQEPTGSTTFSSGAGDIRFDANGVLWIAYQVYDGDFEARVAVDKSCDLGTTWSGSLTINETSPTTADDAVRPTIVVTSSQVSVYDVANAGDGKSDTTVWRYTLLP